MTTQKSIQKQKIIVIVGPTASGKTGLALRMCKGFKGEIISADSRQVYLGMDLGTGKEGDYHLVKNEGVDPQSARILENIPQYLIDIYSPKDQTFTLGDFLKLAPPLIENIAHRQKVPFIVGGTHLYVTALLQGFIPGQTSDKEKEIRTSLETKPLEELLKQLKTLDPKSYVTIDKNNPRRVTRALSATLASGQPFSQQIAKKDSPYDPLILAIDFPRNILYQKIDKRVDDRIAQGMIEEVKNLLDSGVSYQKLQSFGLEYRFISDYIVGKIPKEEMITKLKYAIHSYARRQLIWLRNQMEVHWIKNDDQAKEKIADHLSN